eukprot:3226168-Amphidinium_carterae.1
MGTQNLHQIWCKWVLGNAHHVHSGGRNSSLMEKCALNAGNVRYVHHVHSHIHQDVNFSGEMFIMFIMFFGELQSKSKGQPLPWSSPQKN